MCLYAKIMQIILIDDLVYSITNQCNLYVCNFSAIVIVILISLHQ